MADENVFENNECVINKEGYHYKNKATCIGKSLRNYVMEVNRDKWIPLGLFLLCAWADKTWKKILVEMFTSNLYDLYKGLLQAI